MTFPAVPTVAAGRIISALNTTGGATKTSPDLSTLTKNSGDLLVAIVYEYDGNSTNAEFSGWGGGFTEFGDFATTTGLSIGCAYKFSTGSETGTFTVTTADTSTNDSTFIILSIPGAHPSTPPEAGGYATGVNSAANSGALDPAGWATEDTLWIAAAGCGEDAITGSFTGMTSAPASYTDYFESGITADVVGGLGSAVAFRQNTVASEDPGAWTNDTSNARWGAITIAVRPSPLSAITLADSGAAADSLPVAAAATLPDAGAAADQVRIPQFGAAPTADASGTPHQDRVLWAAAGSRWWLVTIDRDDPSVLRLGYSTDLVAWTDAGTIQLVASLQSTLGNNKWGRNLAAATKQIGGVDVVYLWTTYAATTTDHRLYAQRLTLSGGTFTVTHAETQVGTTITGTNNHATMGVAGFISADNFAWSIGGYETTGYGNFKVQRATTADTGSAWTAGWNLSGNIGAGHTQVAESTTILPVGASKVLGIMDEGSTLTLTDDILQWSASPSGGGVTNWTAGGTPPDYANFVDTTADFDVDDWAACRVSDTDIHVVVRNPDTANAYLHQRWNGTSWSAAQTIPTQASKAGAGLFLSSDGTDVWLFCVDSDSANTVRYVKWAASGPAWGSWAALETSTQTRTGLTGFRVVADGRVAVLWTEVDGASFRLVTKPLAVSAVTSKTLTDSAVAADSLTADAAALLTDQGTAADTLPVAVAVSLTDQGAAADSLTVVAAATLTDASIGVDSLTVDQGATPKTLTDSGQAADLLQVAATVTLADQGVAADRLGVAAAATLTDGGIGRDWIGGPAGTLLASNNFNSGSGAVTTGNSGGSNGTAFTSVVGTPAGNTLTYDSGQALVTLGVTAGEAYTVWDTTVLGSQATRFARLEPTFASVAPAGAIRLFRFLGAGASRGAVQLTTGGRLQLINSAGSTLATGTVAVPTGSRIRVELRIVGDPTVGELEVRWWADPTSSGPPTETLGAVGTNTGGVVDAIRAGHSGTVQANFAYDYDNLAVANDTWAGPAATPIILADSGLAADTQAAAAQVPLGDQATASDQLQVAAAAVLPEQATAADAVRLVVAAPLGEQGAGSDSLQVDTGTAATVEIGAIRWVTGAGATPKTLSDSGAAAEQLQPTAGVPLADSGQAADLLRPAAQVTLADSTQAQAADQLQVAAQVPLGDQATAAESMTLLQGIPQTLTDSGAAADTLTAAVQAAPAEQGTAADQLQVAAQVPVAQQGTATDSLAVGQFEPKTLGDSGTAVDQVTVTVAVPLTDQGLAGDQVAPAAAVLLTQSGAATDVLQTTQAGAPNLFDQGVAADTATVAATVPLSDSGQAADSLSLAQAHLLPDSATAADALQVGQFAAPTLTDAAAAVDQVLPVAQTPLAEQAAAGDTLTTSQAAAPQLADSGQAAEQLTVTQAKLLTDSGTAADQPTVNAGRVLTDQGTAADLLRPTALAVLADQATTADILALSALSALRDNATATDTMVVLTVAYWIRTSSQEPDMTTVGKEPAGTSESREPALATSSREKGTL